MGRKQKVKFKRLTKDQAIKPYGSGNKLAEALGVTKGAVSFWRSGEPIPLHMDLALRYVVAPEKFNAPYLTGTEVVQLVMENRGMKV